MGDQSRHDQRRIVMNMEAKIKERMSMLKRKKEQLKL